MKWHFGGPVPREHDYRHESVVKGFLPKPHERVLVLGISRLGKTTLLHRISEELGKEPHELVIAVSSAKNTLRRIGKSQGVLLLDEAQKLQEWKGKELRELCLMIEDRPFLMAAHPSLWRKEMKPEVEMLLQDARKERLGPLEGDSARDMIRQRRCREPLKCDEAVVEAIYQATGGFPNLIAGLCRHLTSDGREALWALSEADLRGFARSDLGGFAFKEIYASLPPQMQKALHDSRQGVEADLEALRDHFLVSGPSAAFSASLFSVVWGPKGVWVPRTTPRKKGPERALTPVDFCIITALEEEREAVLGKLKNPRKLEPDGKDAHVYYEAWIETTREDGASYRVIVTSQSEMGPYRGANKANAVSHRWNPRHVLLVGIAGGVEGEVALGDVMVASRIADYTLGKERDGEPREIRWDEFHADASLLNAAHNFARGWQKRVGCERPEVGEPKRVVGVVASGGNVIAAKAVIADYRARYSKLIGVEMEGGGVAAALDESIPRPCFLMIRGVSDLADGEANAVTKARWRKYACHSVAAYAIGLLRSGPVPATEPNEAPDASVRD